MLKVVGASWFKTRVSTWILIIACLLAIGAFFIADMERPTFNGTYCATSYWTKKSGFRVEFWGQQNELELVAKGGARACYKDSIQENGWSQIEIETQNAYPDRIQAFAAGILEGALTWKSIYLQWSNTIDAECEKDDDSREFCEWLREIISNNVESVKEMAELKGDIDHFWYQIKLFYYQLDGIEFGFRKGVRRSRTDFEIPPEDFLLLNSAVDIRDLKLYYKNLVKNDSQIDVDETKGQIMLRILENDSFVKILLGHTSDGSYTSMLRVLKKYTFRYHYSSEHHKSNLIPGTNIMFTSYPGVISSLDDFYVISGRHHNVIVAGVKIKNRNQELWKTVDLDKSILMSARLMAANRLAHNGRSWSKYFARSPGTGAKQWLVVDTRHLHRINYNSKIFNEISNRSSNTNTSSSNNNDGNNVELPPNYDDLLEVATIKKLPDTYPVSDGRLFWIVDQLPGRLHAEDATENILKDGFWNGNGVPYFEELQIASRVWPNNHSDISSTVVKNITNLDALGKLMKKLGYRGDLKNENPYAYGNIDLKLFSETNLDNVEFQAYSGPIFENVDKTKIDQINSSKESGAPANAAIDNLPQKRIQPFDWSHINHIVNDVVAHEGHPDRFNFQRVSPKWAWL
uniref:Phospholipase B-like n=1 Tax=Corethrella appendiculata TaxID=1370023 RepID=U5EWZ1_9DIPT